MNTKNSTNVVRIDTHRLTAMEEDVRYPIDMHQGRSATNPVPAISMLAGKPMERPSLSSLTRWALFWAAVWLAVGGAILAVLKN